MSSPCQPTTVAARPVFRVLGAMLALVALVVLVASVRDSLRTGGLTAAGAGTWTAVVSALALLSLGGLTAWRGTIPPGWVTTGVLLLFVLVKAGTMLGLLAAFW